MFKSKKLLLLIPIVAIALVSYTYTVQNDKEVAIDEILMQSLNSAHFAPKDVNDDFYAVLSIGLARDPIG